MFVNNRETSTTLLQFFFFLAFGIVIYLIYNKNKDKVVEQTTTISTYIDKLENMVVTSDTSEMMIATVYKIHKPLTSLRYIKSSEEAKELLYGLRFLLIYDIENMLDFVTYLEYFLKTHFNIIIGKYDVKTHVGILRDIRSEMLNLLHASHFNIPNISTVYDSKDLDENLKLALKRTIALTYKMIKIVFRKYFNVLTNESYGDAIPFDTAQSDMYNMY